jgi:hypothetical protein
LLPPHAPDMLTVRIQVIDGRDFHPVRLSALSAAHNTPTLFQFVVFVRIIGQYLTLPIGLISAVIGGPEASATCILFDRNIFTERGLALTYESPLFVQPLAASNLQPVTAGPRQALSWNSSASLILISNCRETARGLAFYCSHGHPAPDCRE